MPPPPLSGLLLWDGRLSRLDAGVLLGLFAVWLTLTAREASRSRASVAVEVLEERNTARAAGAAVLGLVLLIGAGQSIVWAAKGIGELLGLDEFVVGATLVAIGTSTPELATTIISRVRKHDELGVGTVIGSNIFNNLWIVGVAALISPVDIGWSEVAVAITAGVIVTLLVIPVGSTLGRGRGVALVGTYVAFAAVLLTTSSG